MERWQVFMESMVSKTHAMAVKDIQSFAGDDGWFGTVYRLRTFDPAGGVNMLPGGTVDAFVSIIHNRSDGSSRVFRTDGLGDPLNVDGSVPETVSERTGFITEVSEPVVDASVLTVLFNAV